MKKVLLSFGVFLLVVSIARAEPVIDPEEISLKAGPTQRDEVLRIVWLESYVYPKAVKEDRTISLGVRSTSNLKGVVAAFDFNKEEIALTSSDGMLWTSAYQIPEGVSAGLHLVRYTVQGTSGTIKRNLEFYLAETPLANPGAAAGQGEATKAVTWPLTVVATCSALVDGSSRILYVGEELTGVSKHPWYKVVFKDGEEGWVSAAVVKEPLEEFYRSGYQAYLDQDFDQAIEKYKKSVAINPNFQKGHFWLAKSYYCQGELAAAYASLLDALAIDGRDLDCRLLANNIADNLRRVAHNNFVSRQYREAIADYKMALDLEPGSLDAWLELGRSYANLDLQNDAQLAWREALKLSPEDPGIYALVSPRSTYQSAQKLAARPAVVAQSDDKTVSPDETVRLVRTSRTDKGTEISAALKSVFTLTKSLGTPVVEKGWKTIKQGDKYLVRYLCEQGTGAQEVFEWLVDAKNQKLSAANDNAKLLMERW